MGNLWKQPGIPHKGWIQEDVIDIREDGQPEWDTPYETCMMCGNEKIRYVHILTHQEINEEFRVGCICAEKMTNDYVTPKRLENELQNRAKRLKTWKQKEWKRSQNGNLFLKYEGHHILIYRDKKTNLYKVKIDETFGNKTFKLIEEAKSAAFKGVEYFKEAGEW